MSNELQAIATIFSLVNPTMCVAMFMQIEKDRPRSAQVADATKAVLASMAVFLVAAFLGSRILHIFGVSLDAFSVAGGTVLAGIGFSMLSGRGSASTPDQTVGSSGASDGAVTINQLADFVWYL